ncbi:MAG: dockerin type I repeat-containing protein, partial [Clostridia bacterium]|nr:dockerin type I repeat-containing protein [Clostridia bacterium]
LGAAVDSGYHTHEWNAGVVTVAPTYTETGIRTYTCIGCGMTCTEEIPVLDPLPGDVNGDGKTNSKDLSMMKRIISGAVSEGFVIANTDVDGNGRYNSRDLASIKRIVAGA